MVEVSRFWNGTTTGDATEAPYDADTEFAEVIAAIAETGVVFGQDNELSASSGVASVVLATGQAFVDGTWYKNRNALTFSTTTTGNIILRKDWASQTVRAVFVAGALSLTNTPGTRIETALWGVAVDGGGAITLTDLRSSALPRVGGVAPASIEYSDPAVVGASGIAADASHQHAMAHGPAGAVKPTDTARSATTVLDDPHLTVPLVSGVGKYTFTAYLVYTESIDLMGLVVGITAPGGGGTTLRWSVFTVDDTDAPAVLGPFTGGTTPLDVKHTGDRSAIIKGSFQAGGVGGNLIVQWGTSTGGGGSTTLRSGSSLEVLRVS
jgi:hypothetical protein